MTQADLVHAKLVLVKKSHLEHLATTSSNEVAARLLAR